MTKLTRHDIDQLLKRGDLGQFVHAERHYGQYEVFVWDQEKLVDLVLHLVNRRDDIARVLSDTEDRDSWEHGLALYSVENARKLGQALRRMRERGIQR